MKLLIIWNIIITLWSCVLTITLGKLIDQVEDIIDNFPLMSIINRFHRW